MTFETIIKEVRSWSIEDQTRLIHTLVDLVSTTGVDAAQKPFNILEFEGVGAEMWAGVDSDKFLNDLRDEWDHQS